MHCETKTFTIAKFFVEKNSINDAPEYQRQASAWGREKKHLFLHTLFGDYDVPKIYMHKLPPNGTLHIYALVDGKQRLQCIWDFLDNKITLGDYDYKPSDPIKLKHSPFPAKGDCYSDLNASWQEQFKAIQLDVVIIHEADMDDIEDLFLRLNNGEPLNAAEKRNGMGGDMCQLIRDTAQHDFFKNTIYNNSNKRYQHYDIVARFLLIESGIRSNKEPYCILKKKFLDHLVKKNDQMDNEEKNILNGMVSKQLNTLMKVFDPRDPLLKKAGLPQLYYLFVKEMEKNYASPNLLSEIKKFLPHFEEELRTSLKLTPEEKEEEKHAHLAEFERLTQQNNDKISLEKRVATMIQFFLQKYPETKLRDSKRNFSEPERYAIYIRSGKKCENCGNPFNNYKEFQADHVIQWAHGGETTLNNARALCRPCNAKLNKKVA